MAASSLKISREIQKKYWNELVCDSFQKLETELHYDADFSIEIASRQIGQLQFNVTTTHAPHHVTRSHRQVKASNHNLLWLNLVISGQISYTNDDHAVELAQGDFALLDSARPGALDFSSNFKGLWVGIPRAQLERRSLAFNKVLGCRIDGHTGAAYVVSKMLETFSSQLQTSDGYVFEKLCGNVLDMVCTVFDGAVPDSKTPLTNSKTMLLHRIHQYIEKNIADESLSPNIIAKANGISLRYLNKLFEQEPLSVARYIWDQRLDRCRMMLKDPQQSHRYISEIVYSNGFNNVSHFNRSFRERFGCSPGAYRQDETKN